MNTPDGVTVTGEIGERYEEVAVADDYADFLTLPAYERMG